MKTKRIIQLTIVGIVCTFVGCTSVENKKAPVIAALDSLKARYAPDSRVAVFDVSFAQQGSVSIARGDVDNPKAREEALAAIKEAVGSQPIDSIKVLPDPQLGDKSFGIVAVSVANVRTSPRHPAELCTQAVMGTVAKILKKHGGWCYVQLPDKYIGWVEDAAMKSTNAAGVEEWKAAPKVIVTSHFAIVHEQSNSSSLPVRDAVAGGLMKLVHPSAQWVAVELPDGKTGYIEKSNVEEYSRWKSSRKLTAENIEKTAKTFLGVPYLWGGTSAKGLDCSGFTKTVYRLNGLELSRDADQQAEGGEDVKPGENFENLKKGDLLFFGRKGSQEKPERITHVGIYLANREFIHSPGGSYIKFNSFDPAASNYSESLRRSFVRARRYVGMAQVPEVKSN